MMTSIIKTIIKRYNLVEFAHSVAFNIARVIGFIQFPSYNPYFRRLMNAARAGYWSPKVGKMGKGVQIDSGVIIRGNPKNVEIGDYSYLDTNVQLEVYAPIKIGRYVHITPNAYIESGDEVVIGDFACVTNGTRIYRVWTGYYRGLCLCWHELRCPTRCKDRKRGCDRCWLRCHQGHTALYDCGWHTGKTCKEEGYTG